MVVVASPEYLRRVPAPRHPNDLLHHNCIRFRFTGTGRIHKWEFQIDERLVEYEVKGNLTISDTTFGVDAAMEGIGLAYVFEALALPHIRAKRLKQVLTAFSPTFPGFYLYYPNREHQSTKLKALIDYVTRRARRIGNSTDRIRPHQTEYRTPGPA
jgi:DNA-binding transcriptional LysR family regulator